MIKGLLQGLEDWMAAAAFAEAGDHKTARELIARPGRRKGVLRKRLRGHRRAELSAQSPRV